MDGATEGPIARRSAGSAIRPALWLLAAAAGALALVELSLGLTGPVEPAWLGVLFPAAATGYVGSGLLAWYRRPANRTGPLLVASGLLLLVAGFELTGAPVLAAVGTAFSLTPVAAILHLLMAFPSGRLATSTARWTTAAGWVVIVVLDLPKYLFTTTGPLSVAELDGPAAVAFWAQRIAVLPLFAWVSVVLVQRYRRATPSQRRTLAPLYGFGVATLLYIVFAANVLPPLFGTDLLAVSTTQLVAIGLVPFAFTYGVLRGGFARTAALEDLGLWLARGDHGQQAIRAAVADTVGDPDVAVLFRDRDGWVDRNGQPVDPELVPGGRTARPVRLQGEEIAAIVYDAASVPDTALVDSVGGIVAIALDRERLVAELRASRARVTDAADEERRRIARDLHDGVQARLVLLRVQASGDGEAAGNGRADLRAGLDHVIDELRRLVHGVMPALLVEQGLAAALEDLVDRMPLRTTLDVRLGGDGADGDDLAPVVRSTAYFLVAEALTNAVKHSGASRLTVRLTRDGAGVDIEVADDGRGGARMVDGGLRGVRDRVEALGGGFEVTDRPDGGTVLRGRLPCGW